MQLCEQKFVQTLYLEIAFMEEKPSLGKVAHFYAQSIL